MIVALPIQAGLGVRNVLKIYALRLEQILVDVLLVVITCTVNQKQALQRDAQKIIFVFVVAIKIVETVTVI